MTNEDLKNFGDLILKNIEEQVKHENELMLQNKRYKEVLDKIKEYIKNRKEEYNNATELSRECISSWHYCKLINDILELLEGIE